MNALQHLNTLSDQRKPEQYEENDSSAYRPPIFDMSDEELAATANYDFTAEDEQQDEQQEPGPEQWPRPLPITTSLRSVLPMEPSMIPEPLRAWLCDIAYRIKCPLDFVAATAVVMLSALIGTRLTLHPKTRDDWNVVPNLWGAVIGGPSTTKTPSISAVLKPLTRLVLAARDKFDKAMASSERETVEYDAKKKAHASQAQDRHKGKKVDKPVDYPKAPEKPKEKRYMVNDTTVEKLADLLIDNPTGLLHIRDELTGLLASWEKSGHEEDRAFHLEAWNGNGSKAVDRIGRGSTYVPLVCESIFGGIQPTKLLPYLQAASGFENDGFVQRLQIAVYPDPAPWNYEDEYPDKAARDKAFDLIKAIDDSDFKNIAFDKDTYQRLPYTRFSPDAQEVFKQWLIKLQTEILPNESGLLEEHFNKYRSLMPSLALIFHVVNVTYTPPADTHVKQLVSVDAAQMAVRWCDYLASHARRIYGLLDTAPLEAAKDILRHIRQADLTDGFKIRDVQQKRWKGLATLEQIDAALSELITRHYLREVLPERDNTPGRPEAARYQISPEINQNA